MSLISSCPFHFHGKVSYTSLCLLPQMHLVASYSSNPKDGTHVRRNRTVVLRTVYKGTPRFTIQASSGSPTAESISGADKILTPSARLNSASDVVTNFYGGINSHELAAVEGLIAENCVYEDLIFPRPFVGRKAVLEFFKKFIDSISTELQFIIDDISDQDTTAVGVVWHLEWKGKPFPFSKGCSFYRLEVINGVRQITYARDSVEPTIKPGESALAAIRGVTWLLQQFPWFAEWL
ncbi:hypothetical protein Nepgr_013406 [Nepenthes gracilis]|uniref:SnoaL-like domain-containing protein n=1 Tax=Nepenthes gracilis TaxID=150966 RepID=A0AAD3XPC9_NEPGR|nr:hypothetical protein Nepgr_013406 [Nepenthes gracilis]